MPRCRGVGRIRYSTATLYDRRTREGTASSDPTSDVSSLPPPPRQGNSIASSAVLNMSSGGRGESCDITFSSATARAAETACCCVLNGSEAKSRNGILQHVQRTPRQHVSCWHRVPITVQASVCCGGGRESCTAEVTRLRFRRGPC